ncbi:EVE domain-containing protein [Candidatus Woesearchaeota archaeon]|nr:EVE domain-containing protein [Candidatus Woesearchaeota archaeon]
MNYWLFKSEPSTFSIEHLKQCFNQTTSWDGVRNFQARNFLRDQCKKGDMVLFYHSNANPPAAAGVAMVVKEGYVDHTAFDAKDKHYDPKSKREKPTWYMVDLKFVTQFRRPISLDQIKKNSKLNNMVLIKPGTRLSIQPITREEFEEIVKMGQ